MDTQKQQYLRSIARTLLETRDVEVRALAEGTLELLDTVEELQEALDETVKSCCEAIALVYNYGTLDPLSLFSSDSREALPASTSPPTPPTHSAAA